MKCNLCPIGRLHGHDYRMCQACKDAVPQPLAPTRNPRPERTERA